LGSQGLKLLARPMEENSPELADFRAYVNLHAIILHAANGTFHRIRQILSQDNRNRARYHRTVRMA